jgi:hypothetical protein
MVLLKAGRKLHKYHLQPRNKAVYPRASQNGLNSQRNGEQFRLKVLLVYPHYPNTFWSLRNTLRIISKKAAFPPLGLLTVGAMLPEELQSKMPLSVDTAKHVGASW